MIVGRFIGFQVTFRENGKENRIINWMMLLMIL